MKPEDAQFRMVAQRLYPNSRLLRSWTLHGGISAQVTALEIARPDSSIEKVIVRRHGSANLNQNPNIAQDEFRLMQILHASGLPTPSPYYADQSGEIFPTPYIVVEYIEGDTDFSTLDRNVISSQLARNLARIHSIGPGSADLSFLPKQKEIYARKLGKRPAMLDESLDEVRIRDVLEAVWPLGPRNADKLMHGDYWPGNTLWKEGRLVGIIDWEDALVGDPIEDLANSRLEVLWAFGVEAMHSFTNEYLAVTDIDTADLPYWDLCAALRPAFKMSEWADNADREKAMREGHRLFVAQAFEKLAC